MHAKCKRAGALSLILLLVLSLGFGGKGYSQTVYPPPSATRQITGEYSASTVYVPSEEKYLSVYQEYNDFAIAAALKGQFLDYEGDAIGNDFTIVTVSLEMPENPHVIYNDEDNEFLVVWNDGISTARQIKAVRLDMNGNKIGSVIQIDDPVGGFESHDSPRAAFDPEDGQYAIVWNDRTEEEILLDGVLINSDLSEPQTINFERIEEDVDTFDITYDMDKGDFIIAMSYGRSNPVIRTGTITGSAEAYLSDPIAAGLSDSSKPKIVHNPAVNDEYLVWMYDEGSKYHLMGKYKGSTGSLVEFTTNLLDEPNTLGVAVNEDNGHILVAWIESIGDEARLYTQELDAEGAPLYSAPVMLDSENGEMTDLALAYSPSMENFVITYILQEELGQPALETEVYPMDEALDMTGVTQLDSAKNVEEVSSEIETLIESNRAELPVDDVERSFEILETNIENIDNEEILVPALEKYFETVGELSTAVNDPASQKFVEEKLVDMTTVLSKSIQNVDDNANVATLTQNFLKQVETVQGAGLEKTKEMNITVGELAQSVINKVGEVEPEFQTVQEGEKTKVVFDPSSLQTQVTETAQTFETVKGAFGEYYGDKNIRDFDFKVTLATERVGDKVQVPLGKELIDTLQGANVDKVGVKVGGTQLNLDSSLFTSEGNAGKDVAVDMGFNDQSFTTKQNDLTFKKGYTTDVEVLVGNTEKKLLEDPVSLSFDLDQFEFWEEQVNPSLVSVFRKNPTTGEWEPVGGVYDPVTNSVSTRRITLSQYTVMQANKAFNDVENSWAKSEINELLGKGIIDETEDFNPEEAITREEFTTWVTRAYGLTDENATAPFADIAADNSHYDEIASAYNQGIISGTSETTFAPDGNITKEQMTVILANAMVSYDQKVLNEGLNQDLAAFRDGTEVAEWASDEVAFMIELGILSPGERGIEPQDTITKEMAASILKKIYG